MTRSTASGFSVKGFSVWYNKTMKSKALTSLSLLSFSFFLFSCQEKNTGKIIFDLGGGTWTDPTFSSEYLEGIAGTRVQVRIPDVQKPGYFFVGWREMNPKTKKYSDVATWQDETGAKFFKYSYGTIVYHAYFEPLTTLKFHLTRAEERKGALVAPLLGSENFDLDQGVLNGYVSKKIASTSYLPSATGENLHFQYWYTKYPLIKKERPSSEDASLGEAYDTHYVLDTSKEEGVYRFDEQFHDIDKMEFPEAETNSIDLYAFWKDDPKMTIHFNLPGIDDQTYYYPDKASDKLIEAVKDALNISFDTQSYYPTETKKYRLEGFFLDSGFESPFYLESKDQREDLNIYLKWNRKVSIVIDPDGGVLSEETVSGDWYVSDTLPSDFLVTHTPHRDNASFLRYEVKGKAFDPEAPIQEEMLDENDRLVLNACYDEYPLLTISFDYPTGYSSEKKDDVTKQIRPGEDISAFLEATKAEITDPELSVGFYVCASSSLPHVMPKTSLSLSLQLDYRAKIKTISLYNPSGTYVQDESLLPEQSVLMKDTPMNLADFPGVNEEVMIADQKYLFHGYFQDPDLTKEAEFPLYCHPSHTDQEVLTYYRKMTKAVCLSFFDLSTGHEIEGTISVLPSGVLADYKSQLQALVGSYSHLYADAAKTIEILTLLPDSDCTLYVER